MQDIHNKASQIKLVIFDVDGVLSGTNLLTTLVVVDTSADTSSLSGTVVSVDGTLITVMTDGGDQCVDAGRSAVYMLSEDDSSQGDTGDVVVDKAVDIYGSTNPGACFDAETVLVAD